MIAVGVLDLIRRQQKTEGLYIFNPSTNEGETGLILYVIVLVA